MHYIMINGINPYNKRHKLFKVPCEAIGNDRKLETFIYACYDQVRLPKPYIEQHPNYLIIECLDEKALAYILDAYTHDKEVDNHSLMSLFHKDYIDSTGWTTRLILAELEKKNIPWTILGHPKQPIYLEDEEGFIFYYFVLGHGKNQRRLQQSILDNTSDHAVQIATNKEACKQLLHNLDIPTPIGQVIHDEHTLIQFFHALKEQPVVIKPSDNGGGLGCYVKIDTSSELIQHFQDCKKRFSKVLVEQYIEGEDARICVIDYKAACAFSRIPPSVKGDGKSSIQTLIDEKESAQGENHACRAKILIDEETQRILDSYHYDLQTVLAEGEEICLQRKVNIASGAIVKDITESVSKDAIEYAETICRYLQLNVAAVDFIISKEGIPYVIEVNACPGLDNHMAPNIGQSRNFATIIAHSLFAPKQAFRVPLLYVNDSDHLFGPHQAKNNSEVQLKLQDPGLEHLVFHCEAFWEKGLPVHQLDIMLFCNEKNSAMLAHLPENTMIICDSKPLYQALLNTQSALRGFPKRYFIDNDILYTHNDEKVFSLSSKQDLFQLVSESALSHYDSLPSILLPKEFQHA